MEIFDRCAINAPYASASSEQSEKSTGTSIRFGVVLGFSVLELPSARCLSIGTVKTGQGCHSNDSLSCASQQNVLETGLPSRSDHDQIRFFSPCDDQHFFTWDSGCDARLG